MGSPAISVIIPVYNVEDYLEECIDSALAQTETDFEIICVNDGSTDGSRAILEGYSKRDKRIRIIDKENGGQSTARNMGLDAANGQYIYYLDADDMIHQDALSVCRTTADTYQLDAFFFDGHTIHENGVIQKKRPDVCFPQEEHYDGIVMSGAELLSEMIKIEKFRVIVGVQFVRRDLLLKHNLKFSEGVIFEDSDYSIRLYLLAERVMHKPEGLFIRRIREGSTLTSGFTAKRLYGRLYGIRKLHDFMNAYDFIPETLEGALLAIRERQRFLMYNYELTAQDQRESFKKMLTDQEALDFALYIESYAEANERGKRLVSELQAKEDVLRSIENSRSYKLARTLSRKFRKLKG